MAAAEGSDGGKMIVLVSADGERFELPEAAAKLSQIVLYMIEDGCCYPSIPLPKVDGVILAKIVEYCNKHAALSSGADGSSDAASERSKERELKIFDAEFMDVDVTTLFDVMMAANYLNIKGLLDLACQRTADLMKGKSPEQIRQTFGIKNDFTPEEEEAIRKENAWAFDNI
ncbi:hypothetical protein ABZP36_034298 [Zizania latifolia]